MFHHLGMKSPRVGWNILVIVHSPTVSHMKSVSLKMLQSILVHTLQPQFKGFIEVTKVSLQGHRNISLL